MSLKVSELLQVFRRCETVRTERGLAELLRSMREKESCIQFVDMAECLCVAFRRCALRCVAVRSVAPLRRSFVRLLVARF